MATSTFIAISFFFLIGSLIFMAVNIYHKKIKRMGNTKKDEEHQKTDDEDRKGVSGRRREELYAADEKRRAQMIDNNKFGADRKRDDVVGGIEVGAPAGRNMSTQERNEKIQNMQAAGQRRLSKEEQMRAEAVQRRSS